MVQLHARRKRQQEAAAADAAGTRIWTDEFSPRARARLLAIFNVWMSQGSYATSNRDASCALMDQILRMQIGEELGDSIHHYHFEKAMEQWPDDLIPSLVEAAFHSAQTYFGGGSNAVEEAIRDILAEEGLAYELVDGQMVEFASRELHVEVVEPVLRLLAGRSGWENVEKAYQDALREIGRDAGDAITDAGSALQEALAALGCDGNALGPLIKSARAKGLLAPHDSPMMDAVQRVMDWVSADRSQTGDAHKASAASTEDAWLVVHVVGAVILRLAGGPRT